MNIKPIGPQILLRFLPDEAPKPDEIYLGSNPDKGPKRAEVIALGSGARNEKGKLLRFEVKVGDVVLVDRYTQGHEIKEEGVSYCLVREEGLLGIVEST